MARIDIGDAELSVVDEGSGPVLLLVHGFPLDHTMWSEQIGLFAKTHRVLAPDLRGFGESDVTSGSVTMQQFADDLAAMLDKLSITEQIIFCGLSMGGYIAWQFATRHRAKLGRLIVADTRAVADSPETAEGREKSAQKVLKEGAGVVADVMMPKLFYRTGNEEPAYATATREVMLNTHPEGIAAALRGMAKRPDMSSRLAEIAVPTLVICGQHDAIAPPTEMRKIAEALPHGRYVQIEGAGHMPPLEKPEATNAAIAEFLSSTGSAGSH